MKTRMTAGFVKVPGNAPITENGNTYTLSMAKNETESCQVLFRSEKAMGGLSFAPIGEDDGLTVTLYYETTLSIKGEAWQDPLAPMPRTFLLSPGFTQGIFISVRSRKDTEAGEHILRFGLYDPEGGLLETFTVTVRVWRFAYPDVPSMVSTVGIDRISIAYQLGFTVNDAPAVPENCRDEVERIYKKIYDLLLDYKLCGMGLPYDLLDDRADAYLDDPRVTTVYVSHTEGDEKLQRIYEKLCRKPEWIGKAYMYPVDEPTSREMMDDIGRQVAGYRAMFPKMRFATSYFCNPDYDGERDQTAFLADTLDILCLKVKCWNDRDFYSPAQAEKYPPMLRRTRALQEERGKTVWSYVCWEPGAPYTNLYVNEPGVNHRILFWQQYMAGSTGFLYWDCNFWKAMPDTWTDMATVTWLSDDIFGDGSLLYCGRQVAVDGACPSKRIEAVRDGIEDYELLRLAAERLGTDAVKQTIARVITDIVTYTDDHDLFTGVRASLGDALNETYSE